jgi:hypothetical protein
VCLLARENQEYSNPAHNAKEQAISAEMFPLDMNTLARPYPAHARCDNEHDNSSNT